MSSTSVADPQRRNALVFAALAGFMGGVSLCSLLTVFFPETGERSSATVVASPLPGLTSEELTADLPMAGKRYCPFRSDGDWSTLALPKCAPKGEAESFLMVFMGESASTAIQRGVMKHSRIYERDPIIGPAPDDMELIENTPGEEQQMERVRGYFTNASKKGQIPGFKVRPGHTTVLRKLIDEYNPRFIWNFRQNFVSRAIGMIHKRQFHLPHGGFRNDTTFSEYCNEFGGCTFTVDIDELLDTVRQVMIDDVNVTRALDEMNGACILPVPYEEFEACPDRVLAQIYKFLGLEYEYFPSQRTKISAANLCEMVDNWDEVCAALMPCRDLRWQLDFDSSCKCINLEPAHLIPRNCPFSQEFNDRAE